MPRSVAQYVVVGLLMAGAAGVAWTVATRTKASPPPLPDRRIAGAASGDAIACLGRILPEDGLFRLSARSISGQPAIVAELLVKEGEAVQRGQLVAVLNSRDELEAAWRAAQARVQVARTRLAQVQAGAKPADLEAQRAEIARLEAEHATADRDFQRFNQLFKAGAASAAELDVHRLRADTAAQLLAEAKEHLKSLADVRRVDVANAEAEVEAAVRAETQARAASDQSQIRSPIDGRVIAIHTWPGEEVRDAGIMEVGQTARMYAVAEVDETDVPRLRVGQHAEVTGSGFTGALTGVVTYIALEVVKNDEHNVDPVAPTDARVVQAKVRLDDAAAAARLINAQVTVRIAR